MKGEIVMEKTCFTDFCELNDSELLEVEGGITFLAACMVVGKIVVGSAAVGFIGGCGYELIFG